MVNYTCYRCEYITTHKSKIVNHINRKHVCKPIYKNIDLNDCRKFILKGYSYEQYYESIKSHEKVNDESIKSHEKVNKKSKKGDFVCKYCNKVLGYKQSLHSHYKICKEKKKEETVKQSMSDLVKLLNEKDKEMNKKDMEFKKELDKRDKEYKEQINELIKKAGINNCTITQNIQNNIKLLNYDNTDISHLTDNDYLRCLKHKNFCIPYLIEKIHFDRDKPENHNIYISNLKNKYVMMYEKTKWETKNRDDTLDKLICDKEVLMEEKLGEWQENGNKHADLRNRYDIYIEKRNIKNVINQIKDDVELMLYNNRDLIKKNSN
tara:strand:+ start:226 stop:1188 length:963 start_codon:yes stop_codon:yes gene_type:complete